MQNRNRKLKPWICVLRQSQLIETATVLGFVKCQVRRPSQCNVVSQLQVNLLRRAMQFHVGILQNHILQPHFAQSHSVNEICVRSIEFCNRILQYSKVNLVDVHNQGLIRETTMWRDPGGRSGEHGSRGSRGACGVCHCCECLTCAARTKFLWPGDFRCVAAIAGELVAGSCSLCLSSGCLIGVLSRCMTAAPAAAAAGSWPAACASRREARLSAVDGSPGDDEGGARR